MTYAKMYYPGNALIVVLGIGSMTDRHRSQKMSCCKPVSKSENPITSVEESKKSNTKISDPGCDDR